MSEVRTLCLRSLGELIDVRRPDELLVGGCWSVVAGRWLLVGGCWSVVAGRWLLVGGCWFMSGDRTIR
jgi:hypothetical protein